MVAVGNANHGSLRIHYSPLHHSCIPLSLPQIIVLPPTGPSVAFVNYTVIPIDRSKCEGTHVLLQCIQLFLKSPDSVLGYCYRCKQLN